MDLALGLSAWIVQDGNYGDFERGQRIEVAVEVYFERVEIVAAGTPACMRLEGAMHSITGAVTHVSPGVWVIDSGVQMYCDAPRPAEIAAGMMVHGRAFVGVDHFAYFERFANQPSVPPLIYAWRVKRVLRQTAPFVEIDGVRRRAPEESAWQEIERTDAWVDDGGYAEYVLECELLAESPKRSSATAL